MIKVSKVELRLTEVDPPLPDTPRTIYTDLVNLPDPARLGLTSRIFNYDDVGLYMRVDGSASGWTFTTNNFGLVASGANIYRNIDNFGSRAKPATELTETIIVRLRAYTDSGYTTLKWTFERTITVVFINSADPSYTTDLNNNFDDGTVQGWAVSAEAGIDSISGAVATDYVLSTPYSFKVTAGTPSTPVSPFISRLRMYKSITTPNKAIVYGIVDVRVSIPTNPLKNIRFQRDGTILIYIGTPPITPLADEDFAQRAPEDKWMRLITPLPANTTLEVRIIVEWVNGGWPSTNYSWMDDFKIISK